VLAKPEPACNETVVSVEEPVPARETVIVEAVPAPAAGPLPAIRAAADAA
jgi:hypothetical protein